MVKFSWFIMPLADGHLQHWFRWRPPKSIWCDLCGVKYTWPKAQLLLAKLLCTGENIRVFIIRDFLSISNGFSFRLFFKCPKVKEQFRNCPMPSNYSNHDSFSKQHCKSMAEIVDQVRVHSKKKKRHQENEELQLFPLILILKMVHPGRCLRIFLDREDL